MGLDQRKQLATQLRQNALLLTLIAHFITEQRLYLDYPNLDAQNWWDSFARGRGYFLSTCIPQRWLECIHSTGSDKGYQKLLAASDSKIGVKSNIYLSDYILA